MSHRFYETMLVIAVTFALMIVLSGNVYAQSEFQNGTDWTLIFNQVYSPKVACDIDGSLCLVLYYNGYGATIQQIKLAYTVDGFATLVDNGYHISNSNMDISLNVTRNTYGMSLPLGYDVWVDNTVTPKKFYILVPYIDSTLSGAKVYTWDLNNKNPQLIGSVEKQLDQGQSGVWNTWFPIKIIDKDTNEPKALVFNMHCEPTVTSGGHLDFAVNEHYLKNTTFIQNEIIYHSSGFDATASGYNPTQYRMIHGLGALYGDNFGDDTRIIIDANYGTGITPRQVDEISDTLTVGYDGLLDYHNGYLYYSNLTEGDIYRVSSADLSTFGTPLLYYTFNSSIEEQINSSYIADFNGGEQYVYEYSSNESQWYNPFLLTWFIPRGFSYRESFYPVYVYAQYIDPISGESKSDINIYTELTCGDWTDSSYSTINTLNTPCLTGNNITISSTELIPTSHTLTNVSLYGCDYYSIGGIFGKYYNLTFTVLDDFSYLPVSGASVIIDTGSCTTDANGQCNILINPFASSDMTATYGNCNVILRAESTAKYFSVKVNYTGYDTYFTIGNTFVSFDGSGNPIYTTDKSVLLSSQRTKLNVKLKTIDNVEINPTTAKMYVYNGTNTKWFYNNQISAMPATNFPAKFIMDDISDFNVTASLLYANTIYTKEINVTANTTNYYNFILPFLSNAMPCQVFSDCLSSYCSSDIHYGLLSCTSGLCKYDQTSCASPDYCDDSFGCFDQDSTQACTQDYECIDTCFDFKTLLDKGCGSDGFCKGVFQQCTEFCNTTTVNNQSVGYCTENEGCLLYGGSQDFMIKTPNGVGGYDEASFTAKCSQQNAGKHICVNGYYVLRSQLPAGVTANDFIVYPNGWKYSSNASVYDFYDVSVYCSLSCNLTYSYCQYGCDAISGLCVGTQYDVTSQIEAFLPDWLRWMLQSFVLWTFFALAIGAVLTYIPAKISNHAQPTPQIGVAGMFVVYLIGIPLGFIDPIIGLMILIGLGLALAKFITQILGTGNV
jgi:hypothetical protein